MNTFKNRDNKQTWSREGDKEYDRIVSLEMEKVAPPWTEGPLCVWMNRIRDHNSAGFCNGMNDAFTRVELERALLSCRAEIESRYG